MSITTPKITTHAAILSRDDEPYKLYIRVEGLLPKSANIMLRSHWTTLHKYNLRWKNLIQPAVMAFRPPKPLTKFTITVHRHNWRLLDYDNCVTSAKTVIDTLKDVIIADDSWPMTGAWIIDQAFRSKKLGSLLELYIEEVKEDQATES